MSTTWPTDRWMGQCTTCRRRLPVPEKIENGLGVSRTDVSAQIVYPQILLWKIVESDEPWVPLEKAIGYAGLNLQDTELARSQIIKNLPENPKGDRVTLNLIIHYEFDINPIGEKIFKRATRIGDIDLLEKLMSFDIC
jgi:hypothetical protein